LTRPSPHVWQPAENITLENANGVTFNKVNILPNSGNGADFDPVMRFINSRDVTISGARAFVGTNTFLRVEGGRSNGIHLRGNDLSHAAQEVDLARGVPLDAVDRDESRKYG